MVSSFKNLNKLDLAHFETDTDITESFGSLSTGCALGF